MQKLALNLKQIHAARDGIYFPDAQDWPKEFGLPECVGALLKAENDMNIHSILTWIDMNLADVMPAIHCFWHWMLVGKHDYSAMKLMQGMKNHPFHSQGISLRKAIRSVAADRKAAAEGDQNAGKDLWQEHMTQYMVYGGGYCAPRPHVSAEILRTVCALGLQLPRIETESGKFDLWEDSSPVRQKFLALLLDEANAFKKAKAREAA